MARCLKKEDVLKLTRLEKQLISDEEIDKEEKEEEVEVEEEEEDSNEMNIIKTVHQAVLKAVQASPGRALEPHDIQPIKALCDQILPAHGNLFSKFVSYA